VNNTPKHMSLFLSFFSLALIQSQLPDGVHFQHVSNHPTVPTPCSAAAWLRRRLGRVDRESHLAYTLFTITFLADYSLLAAALPLSAFLYAMVSVRPSRGYWRLALVYTELVIVAQFAFQVPTRLGCQFLSPETFRRRVISFFCCNFWFFFALKIFK
jgi:hypothetical protein